MRIDKLQVHNFRGFSDTEIVLNGKDAIFYGVNGMGKSSILDVCNLLFPVTHTIFFLIFTHLHIVHTVTKRFAR